mmetsp:Transcript_29734/g.79908  ORF Transcript_29734/g.79908 Transcript_29734/m.79908 type:complete len:161 (+) Transcript_29734:78-560(+)
MHIVRTAALVALAAFVAPSDAFAPMPALSAVSFSRTASAASPSALHGNTFRPYARMRALAAMKSSGSNEMDTWRIQAARLEEAHRKDLLQRPRRFLPFTEARKWARAMWFTSREDWMGMINRGEKRNPYLPRRPDEYYEGKGWISWDDFLNDPPPEKSTS